MHIRNALSIEIPENIDVVQITLTQNGTTHILLRDGIAVDSTMTFEEVCRAIADRRMNMTKTQQGNRVNGNLGAQT